MYGASLGAALPLIATVSPALADGDGGGDGGNGGDGNAYRNEAARRFAAFATVLQCSRVPELPLITGDNAVNGGIRYDDETAAWTGVSKWTLQRAARVGDIEHRMNPGVLPMFTIGGMISGDTNPQTKPFIHFELALNYLTEVCGLPRESLSFTTTDVASQTFCGVVAEPGQPCIPPTFVTHGLPSSSITYRPHAEAVAAGDGSGWFFDPRNQVGFPTMSIEFTRDGLTLELGEVARFGFGLGMERVQWAMSGAIPSWNQVLPTLLARIRAEARRRMCRFLRDTRLLLSLRETPDSAGSRRIAQRRLINTHTLGPRPPPPSPITQSCESAFKHVSNGDFEDQEKDKLGHICGSPLRKTR